MMFKHFKPLPKVLRYKSITTATARDGSTIYDVHLVHAIKKVTGSTVIRFSGISHPLSRIHITKIRLHEATAANAGDSIRIYPDDKVIKYFVPCLLDVSRNGEVWLVDGAFSRFFSAKLHGR